MKRYTITFLSMLIISISAAAQLSGPLSGTLGPGMYTVIDDISVQEGDSLTIAPGTELLFDGLYSFDIYGYFYAVGTESDSIFFLAHYPNYHWHGIDFFSTSDDSCKLSYCVITGSISSGIFCENAHIGLSQCLIKGNSCHNFGGGLAFINSSATIENSEIVENSVNNYTPYTGVGGGIYSSQSVLYISNCIIKQDSSSHRGGGIFCEDRSSLTITESVISDNAVYQTSGFNQGGGIFIADSYLLLDHCLVSFNTVGGQTAQGGGIGCDANTGTLKVFNSTITRNALQGTMNEGGAGICALSENVIVKNCIIEGNIGGHGFDFPTNYDTLEVIHNNFYNHVYGSFNYLPPGFMILSNINANGEPCDSFYNLNLTRFALYGEIGML
ncbi:MAG: right-handed parallel beta-helix repeat-containing protein [candidate division Zixibacteria bacterium]|nr:right-handed parallel beta-helix repeat-containing protein [Candidatus Tariuqbacter arcticus]